MELRAVHTRMDSNIYKEVRKYCLKSGMKIRSFIEIALLEKLGKDDEYEKSIKHARNRR